MNRRTILRLAGAATATFVATSGTATATTDGSGGEFRASDCDCDGTYEACCVDGPCDCNVERVHTWRLG